MTIAYVVLAALIAGLLWRMFATCCFTACRWRPVVDLEATKDRGDCGIWQCTRCKSISLGQSNPHRWDAQR